VYSPGVPIVQPHEVIEVEHLGGWALASPVASMVKTASTIAVTAKRVIFIFLSSLFLFIFVGVPNRPRFTRSIPKAIPRDT
jgi:hypothetical protein